ncbi:MAG: TRAM domain-containing protein [Planctomycetes bacterium]|nr:TRAM domain-containing protein [Planctomycetota bacterium]
MLVFIIRILFFLAMVSTGYAFGQAWGTGNELWGMTCLGAAAAGVIVLDVALRRKDISVISAVFFGLIVGLVVAALLGPVLDMYANIPPRVRDVAKIAVATLTAYLAVSLILQTKDDFRFIIPYIEFAKQQKGGRPLLLDTSAIIDGRIADVAATRFIDSPLVVPRFVLRELQTIADSADKLKRDRGRRGLDILNRLQTTPGIDIRIEDAPAQAAPGEGVDQSLVRLAAECSGRILTVDYNLNKVATVSGIEVLNVNDLANALKPSVLPGTTLDVAVLRPGQEEGQGVGYLEDGTMVVVEDGKDQVGKTVTVTVTNVIQKSAGRIIFGRIDAGAGGARPRGR